MLPIDLLKSHQLEVKLEPKKKAPNHSGVFFLFGILIVILLMNSRPSPLSECLLTANRGTATCKRLLLSK